jgi:hypothetical protein
LFNSKGEGDWKGKAKLFTYHWRRVGLGGVGGGRICPPFPHKNEIGWKKLIIHSFQRRGKLVNEK